MKNRQTRATPVHVYSLILCFLARLALSPRHFTTFTRPFRFFHFSIFRHSPGRTKRLLRSFHGIFLCPSPRTSWILFRELMDFYHYIFMGCGVTGGIGVQMFECNESNLSGICSILSRKATGNFTIFKSDRILLIISS